MKVKKILGGVCLVLHACGFVASSASAQSERAIYDDYATQVTENGPQGAKAFGDKTDIYSGSTSFLVTDVSLPGNSKLPVALQRSLKAFDDGMGASAAGFSNEFMAWTRFEVPYLSGIYKNNAGWKSEDGTINASDLRCSIAGGAPEVTQSSGKEETWEAREYWHGNQLYLPGAGTQLMRVAAPGDANAPTDGATYYWVTKDHWYFSCLPQTKNGVAGEGFLARAPDGTKYYFDWLVKRGVVAPLWKAAFTGGSTVLSRAEYRILLTRVEDRFGNWVNYTYSGSDLISISANDGRQLTLNYTTPGGPLSSVTDGVRIWTYDYTAGFRVTFPDSTVWRSYVSGPGLLRNKPNSCSDTALRYSGESTLTIELRSGAIGNFVIRPLRRGLSWVDYNPATYPCPEHPKEIDNLAIFSKSVSGAGIATATWTYTYGPANGCHTYGTGQCTASSPTTRYVEITGPANTFTRYTFGNRWQNDDGSLLRVETGSSAAAIIRDEAMAWQTFSSPGFALTQAGDSYASEIVRREASRTIAQDGASYVTTKSAWDAYFNPQTLVESGPNGGSRTTQFTYHNDRVKWVIGQIASRTSPGRATSYTFNGNANVSSVTNDGIVTSYTYDGEGNIATVVYPRLLQHTFSNYKRGIAQSESQPESVTLTRVVSDAGFITSKTDGELHSTSYSVDAMGRITSIDFPIGNDINIAYSGVTKSQKVSTRGGLVETTQYDALWQPISVTAGGIQTTFEYDAFGRKTFESNPNDSIGVRYEYDVLGRLKKVTHPDLTYRSYTYGPGTTTVRDERGNYTTHTYRAYGSPSDALLISTTAPDPAASTSIVREPSGNVQSITQAGHTRTFTYDARNWLKTETNPETGTTTYVVDDAGNVTSRTLGGVQTLLSYNGQNQLTNVTYSDGTPSVTQTWSKTGHLRTVTSTAASRVIDYDANDNVLTETLTVDSTVLVASYGYDANDRLSSITYPISQNVVSYAPDVLGRPTQVSGYVSSITYWPSGLIRQIGYANGMVTSYEHNSRGWPAAFATKRASFNYIDSVYGYDDAGNLTSVTDGADSTLNRTLSYDALNRLTGASGSWGNLQIAYDGGGNIQSQTLDGAPYLVYSYDTQNRLASLSGSKSATYGYDAHGNVANIGAMSFTYGASGDLLCANCAATTPSLYRYDGLNKRVKITKGAVTTYEFYASSGDLLVAYTPAQANKLVEYIYLGGKRIAQRVSDTAPPTSITPMTTTVTTNVSGGVTLGVTLGGTSPTGTVTFSRAGTALGTAYVATNQASIEVLGLARGQHTITAAYSGDGINSGNALAYQLTVVDPAPSSITVPSGSTTGSYTISWVAGDGTVTAYELYEASNAGFTGQALAYSGTATSKAISGKANGSYYYRVRACNGSVCSGYRTGSNATVVTLPPGTPVSISVPSSSGSGSYTISWATASGSVTAYELYEATNASFTGATQVYSGTGTSTVVSGRTDGVYYYRVRACNGPACSGYQAGTNSTTVILPPGMPASISVPASSTTGSYSITWGTGSGAITAYELYEATNSGFSGAALVYSGAGTSASLSGRTDGTYYYRVRACNGSGCSAYRTGTSGIGVSLPPGVPSSVNVPASSPNGSFTISWGAASGAVTSYQLYEANNAGFSGETLVYNAPGLSAGFAGKGNGTYYYRVRACNASGCSSMRTGGNGVTVALLQASVDDTFWYYYIQRGSPAEIDPPVVVTATGGAGGYTYAWQRVSGTTSINVTSPSSSSTTWTNSQTGWDVVYTAEWRCLVTDSQGNTTYTPTVTVQFERVNW